MEAKGRGEGGRSWELGGESWEEGAGRRALGAGRWELEVESGKEEMGASGKQADEDGNICSGWYW